MVSFSSLTQVVEILFARGLVKVLFATETFAMVLLYHFINKLKCAVYTPIFRGSTCLPDVSSSQVRVSTTGAVSGTFSLENILKWLAGLVVVV